MQQSARATDMMVGDATSEMVRNRLVGWTSIRALWEEDGRSHHVSERHLVRSSARV